MRTASVVTVVCGVGCRIKSSARSLLYLPFWFVKLHTSFKPMYIFSHMRRSLQINSDFPTACAPQSFDFYEICIYKCNPKIRREHSTGLATISFMWNFPILEKPVANRYICTFFGESPRARTGIFDLISGKTIYCLTSKWDLTCHELKQVLRMTWRSSWKSIVWRRKLYYGFEVLHRSKNI